MPLIRTCSPALAVMFAMACGGKPAAAPPSAPLQADESAQAPPVPLEPVPMPREVFAVLRVQNVARLADVGVRWTSLPVDWRNLVAKELPGLERVVAFDAPLDVTAMLDPSSIEPHVFWAFALGVASADAAAGYFRDNGQSVIRRGPGVYALHGSLDCVAAPARGAAPARLVCSEGMDSVDALSPYMTRGLPTETFGKSDFHAYVAAEPFRRRYGSELALVRTMGVPFLLREFELGHPKFDRALRDAMYDVADELIALARDIDRIDMDASLSPREDAIEARTTIAMNGQQSWTAQGIVRASGSAAAAPDFFWQLPKDATAASYSVYADPEHARGLAISLGQLLDGYLDYQELGDVRRRPLVDAFVDLFTTGARSAYASLPVPPLPARTTSEGDSSDDVTKVIGAHVFAVDQGGDRLAKFASALVKAVGDRPFRERVVKSKLLRAEQLPVARERAPKGKKGLPPGSKTFEFEFASNAFSPAPAPTPPVPTKGAAPKKPAAGQLKKVGAGKITVVLLVVPEGPSTWFGFGTDESALVERLLEIRAGNGATLSLRDGLGSLRSDRAISAGFSTLGAVGPSFDSSLFSSDGPGFAKTLGRLPHRGETPLLWDVVFDALGPKVTASAIVPQAVIEDIVALMVSLRPNAIR